MQHANSFIDFVAWESVESRIFIIIMYLNDGFPIWALTSSFGEFLIFILDWISFLLMRDESTLLECLKIIRHGKTLQFCLRKEEIVLLQHGMFMGTSLNMFSPTLIEDLKITALATRYVP